MVSGFKSLLEIAKRGKIGTKYSKLSLQDLKFINNYFCILKSHVRSPLEQIKALVTAYQILSEKNFKIFSINEILWETEGHTYIMVNVTAYPLTHAGHQISKLCYVMILTLTFLAIYQMCTKSYAIQILVMGDNSLNLNPLKCSFSKPSRDSVYSAAQS